MIDTIKIYTMIDKNIYNKIYNNAIIKSSYNKKNGEIYYEIVNDKLEGSYSSSLSVRVGSGAKYNFVNMYYLEIEGSYHKIMNGYNSHNGYYNLQSIVKWLIGAVENTYKIELPSLGHWFLQRFDIAICYDLGNNDDVRRYINNLSRCSFPRRNNLKHYHDESIYCSGTTTTLKIYNKLLEFKKHDMKKLFNTHFNIDNYMSEIDGFIRFECEIKKKKLESIYSKKYIRVRNVNYKDLYEVWMCDFMKLLNMFESDLTIVRDKDDIKRRLFACYSERKANTLYMFYTSIILDGTEEIKATIPRATYYRYIKDLKAVNIDLSQTYKITVERDTVDFNPFEWQEVI